MGSNFKLSGDNLQEALGRVEDQVRNDPASAKHRIHLFQLLTICGLWDRALTQLKVIEDLDASAIPMVGTYRAAIDSEIVRADVFAGNQSPVIFGEPAEWTALLVEALRLTALEKYSEAEALRAKAFESAPATSGNVDGESFRWIADSDSRLGPVFEVVINGNYVWVPIHRISKIDIEEPKDLRDSVWTPCIFTWVNGGEMVGLIPTRYPGTETSEDGHLKMSLKTDWIEVGAETYLGLGQRMLTTDAKDYALMDIRHLEFDSAEETDTDSDHD